MIKINQIATEAQANRIKAIADCIGVCITKTPMPGMISTETLETIRSAAPGIPLSVAFNPKEVFTDIEIFNVLDKFSPDYYEFTPVDFLKKTEFDAQIERLKKIAFKKIANGYFVQPDETSFLDDERSFKRLEESGVCLFQFEIQSAVDNELMLDSKTMSRIDDLAEKLKIIACDNFSVLKKYPIKNIAGYYFNIEASGQCSCYDYTDLSFPLSQILRILSKNTFYAISEK